MRSVMSKRSPWGMYATAAGSSRYMPAFTRNCCTGFSRSAETATPEQSITPYGTSTSYLRTPAVAEMVGDLVAQVVRGDVHAANAGAAEPLDGALHERTVADGQQRLGYVGGERHEPLAVPARHDNRGEGVVGGDQIASQHET